MIIVSCCQEIDELNIAGPVKKFLKEHLDFNPKDPTKNDGCFAKIYLIIDEENPTEEMFDGPIENVYNDTAIGMYPWKYGFEVVNNETVFIHVW